jgi:hypothetical protein
MLGFVGVEWISRYRQLWQKQIESDSPSHMLMRALAIERLEQQRGESSCMPSSSDCSASPDFKISRWNFSINQKSSGMIRKGSEIHWSQFEDGILIW